MDVSELWAIDFLHNEGTNTLVIGDQAKNDGLSGVGAQMSAIQLTMAST